MTEPSASGSRGSSGRNASATVNAAATRLQLLANSNPAALLEGLNDPRLATRITVANILRGKIGDEFDIDPWSDAATRDRAVRQWRGKLAGMAGKPAG